MAGVTVFPRHVLNLPESSTSPLSNGDHGLEQPRPTGLNKRSPRRAQTHYEYILPSPVFTILSTLSPPPPASLDNDALSNPPPPTQQAQPPPTTNHQSSPPRPRSRGLVRLPPPPRRSQSLISHQPVKRHHPNSQPTLTLLDLPVELHYAIMDHLDPIDSTCLGLTNKHFYAIHRRLHGTVPLTQGRAGPNDMEWAWYLCPPVTAGAGLERLKIRGQGFCRLCGVQRCQLYRHLTEWMGEGREYCGLVRKFGPPAPEGRTSYCWMRTPGDLSKCGRHYVPGGWRKGMV
jgi:hypothetical protein